MKSIFSIMIVVILLASPMRVQAEDIAGGLMHFIYGLMYANIGMTSCKEITQREGGKEEMLAKMDAIVNSANSMIGEEKVDFQQIHTYFEKVYNYCGDHPNEMFGQALGRFIKPLFTGTGNNLTPNNNTQLNNDHTQQGFVPMQNNHGNIQKNHNSSNNNTPQSYKRQKNDNSVTYIN